MDPWATVVYRQLAADWKSIFDSSSPHRARFPAEYDWSFNSFQKMAVVRTLRPDKIVPAVSQPASLLTSASISIILGRSEYEEYACPPLLKWLGVLYPTFKRHKRPSFELQLCRNAWAAGALPQTPLGELTAFLRPLARFRELLLKGREVKGGKVEGK